MDWNVISRTGSLAPINKLASTLYEIVSSIKSFVVEIIHSMIDNPEKVQEKINSFKTITSIIGAIVLVIGFAISVALKLTCGIDILFGIAINLATMAIITIIISSKEGEFTPPSLIYPFVKIKEIMSSYMERDNNIEGTKPLRDNSNPEEERKLTGLEWGLLIISVFLEFIGLIMNIMGIFFPKPVKAFIEAMGLIGSPKSGGTFIDEWSPADEIRSNSEITVQAQSGGSKKAIFWSIVSLILALICLLSNVYFVVEDVPVNPDECCIFLFLGVMSLVVSFYSLCLAQRDIAGQDGVGAAGVALSAFTLGFNIIAIITSILLAL